MNGKPAPCRRLYRAADDRKLAGIAGGIAAYFQIDPTLVRLLFIFLGLVSCGTFLLVYLIGWIVIPEEKGIATVPKLYRSSDNKMLGGVCGGLGEFWNVDPTLVRLGVVAATFLTGGTMIPVYLAAWIVMPVDRRKKDERPVEPTERSLDDAED